MLIKKLSPLLKCLSIRRVRNLRLNIFALLFLELKLRKSFHRAPICRILEIEHNRLGERAGREQQRYDPGMRGWNVGLDLDFLRGILIGGGFRFCEGDLDFLKIGVVGATWVTDIFFNTKN